MPRCERYVYVEVFERHSGTRASDFLIYSSWRIPGIAAMLLRLGYDVSISKWEGSK